MIICACVCLCVCVCRCRCAAVCSMQVQWSVSWRYGNPSRGCAGPCSVWCVCARACTCGCHVHVLSVPSGGPSPQAGGDTSCKHLPGLSRLEPLPLRGSYCTSSPARGVSEARCGERAVLSAHLQPPGRGGPFGYSFSPSFACSPQREAPALSGARPGGGPASHGLPTLPTTRCPVPRRAERHGPPQAAGGCRWSPSRLWMAPPGGRDSFCAHSRAGQLESPGPSAQES